MQIDEQRCARTVGDDQWAINSIQKAGQLLKAGLATTTRLVRSRGFGQFDLGDRSCESFPFS